MKAEEDLPKRDPRNAASCSKPHTLVIAPKAPLGIEIEGSRTAISRAKKAKTEFPEDRVKPHGFQTDSPRPGRFSNAWGFQDGFDFFHAGGDVNVHAARVTNRSRSPDRSSN